MILVRHALGEVLRRHRTEQGRTLRDVADAARVSLGYLSEIERGQKEPSSELLYAVSDALGVPLSAVLAETGEHVRAREGATAAASTHRPDGSDRVLVGSPLLTRPMVSPPALNRARLDRPGRDRAALSRPALSRPGTNRAGVPASSPTRVVLTRPAVRDAARPISDLASMPLTVPEPLSATDRLVLTSLTVPIDVAASDTARRERELAHAAA